MNAFGMKVVVVDDLHGKKMTKAQRERYSKSGSRTLALKQLESLATKM